MGAVVPKIILRLGSHAEKEYFEKLAPQLDAVMFGGNLLEITPAATAGFLALLKRKRPSKGAIPYYLDPITYCFGPYIDPASNSARSDLYALKSERSDRKTKKKFVAVKDSYSSLAQALGQRFASAVNDGSHCVAIDPSRIPIADRDAFCDGVLSYQDQRIAEIVAAEIPGDDAVMKEAFEGIGSPAALFAPYFYIHESWAKEGINAAIDLLQRSVGMERLVPVHGVICASHSLLEDESFISILCNMLPQTGTKGIWFWFDGFDEFGASLVKLKNFRRLVKACSGKMEVFNLHGGYFSLLLSHDGLTGISHGVGYGEKKPVAQVIGAAAPTVRYYLPPIKMRVGVPDIQRSFPNVPVRDADDFYREVCSCAICKGVVGTDLRKFSAFGEMHRANATAQRNTQTPTAAKICRFHFLLNRLKERQAVATLTATDRSRHIVEGAKRWRDLFPLQTLLGNSGASGYLERWAFALS